MAEYNDFAKDFENLEELITCGICDEILTEPKSLPKCLHTFCLACIKRWSESCQSERKPVNCPICRDVIRAPGEGVANLTTSFTHKSLIQLYNSSMLKKNKQELKQLKEEIAKQNKDLSALLDRCMTAVEQADEYIKKTDKEINRAKDEVRRNTKVQIKILQKHEKKKLDHLEVIQARRKAKHEEMKNKFSYQIQEILELNHKSKKCKDTNIEELKIEETKQLLNDCKTTIERTKATLSTNQVQCDPLIHYIPNPEVIDALENLQVGKINDSMVDPSREINELLQVDPSRCSMEGVQPTRCGFINQFSIVSRDSKGDQCCTNKALIDINIRDNDGNDVHKEITESENGQVVVKFRVEKPSPYNVAVSIGGKSIQNSPQRIDVINAKAAFQRVRFFHTFRASRPWAQALNGKGDMAVVNNRFGNDCRIVLYRVDGCYVTDFDGEGTGEDRLKDPRGIVFTDDYHILVSDYGGCIKEYRIDGRLFRTVYKQNGVDFTGMCTSGQNIACLSYNIQSGETSKLLFSREKGDHLEDVKLQAPDFKAIPKYLAYDNNKYFVSFELVHSVYVFSENGGLLYTIGQKGDKEGQFNDPRGLAVFGADMLLVCDLYNHRVQLFHQNGVFIRSFGTYDYGLGRMNCPVDVAITQDGQVFILECDGGCIHVFK